MCLDAALAIERKQGWELRLARVIEDARAQPYVLGEHDCFRLACAAVAALTGIDHWPRWAGRYTTRRRALACISAYVADLNPATTAEAFDWAFSRLFGGMLMPIAQARRGDICKYMDLEPHLGVCVGAEVAVLGEHGLAFVPLAICLGVWRVG